MNDGVVIVGAGHAGVGTAVALRRRGWTHPVTVLGDEPDQPYQRPPLSKDVLLGTESDAGLALRTAGYYADHGIELRLGCSVAGIDLAGRRVVLADGRRLGYGDLVLATGSGPRPLPVPGHDLDGVLTLRTLADARRLRERLATVGRVVVVGGGFIGLELAAVLALRGDVAVTVLDVADRLLARAVCPSVSRYVEGVHRERGVEVVLDTAVAEIVGDGVATGVRDGTGRVHPADLVVVGVGAVPRVGLARGAGLAVANGIVVDPELRTGDPHVYAVGDCAGLDGRCLESVQNATDQATHVAAVIAGADPGPYTAVPTFWSDQKGLRLQMVGLPGNADTVQLLGDPASGRFSALSFRDGRMVAVESVNRPPDHMAARRILTGGLHVSPQVAARPGFTLDAAAAGRPLPAAHRPGRPG